MVDSDIPSFSLGLDLDFDSQPQLEVPPNETNVSARQFTVNVAAEAAKEPEGDESRGKADDSDPDSFPTPPRRVLKRLRVGPANGSSATGRKAKPPPSSCLDDEDIEDFSSDDDLIQDVQRSIQDQFTGRISKISWNGFGVLASSLQEKERTRKQVSDPSTSDGLKSGKNVVFSKSTSSPLRRFQLLDSDSNDSSIDEDDYEESHLLNSSTKKRQLYPEKHNNSIEHDEKRSIGGARHENLWKDFIAVESSKIATPALDEVCEEYFRSTDINKLLQAREPTRNRIISNDEGLHGFTNGFHSGEKFWDSANPIPPAHQYFWHNDPRVRTLVRERLRNFSPISIVDKVYHEHRPSAIDYMGQFNNGEASKPKRIQKSSATNRRDKPKNSNAKEAADASGFWVNPKNISSLSNGDSSKRKQTQRNKAKRGSSSTSECWIDPKCNAENVPRDAAKRRVQASSQSRGHWYTSSDGRKVYVTRNGEELTGQAAYRHYRKESGSRFKKSKKKTTGKKKSGG